MVQQTWVVHTGLQDIEQDTTTKTRWTGKRSARENQKPVALNEISTGPISQEFCLSLSTPFFLESIESFLKVL